MSQKIDRESFVVLAKDFDLSKINIIFNPISNRLIDEKTESQVEKFWSKRLKEAEEKGVKLWNSEVYRLNEFCIEGDELYLELSTIDFKTRVALKQSDNIYKLGFDYYSKGLFTSGLIKTTDNKYIFGELNGKTLNSLNRDIDFIGGVLSKDEIKVETSKDLAQALLNEIQEEINVDEKYIDGLNLKGIIHTSSYGTALIFDVSLNIDSETVKELFYEKNDKEMKGIVIVDEVELKDFLESQTGYMRNVIELL